MTGGHTMIKYFAGACLSIFIGFSAAQPVMAQATDDPFYQDWVEYRDGEISVAFEQTPIMVAVHAISARTGVQIILPSSARSKLLNLRLNRTQLEPAVSSLISSIGFRNFALMYDESGRPNRAVVLGASVSDDSRSAANSTNAPAAVDPAVQPLTVAEKETLQKDLERWRELKQEERGRIEDRLKTLPASDEREEFVKEYGRQLLGIKD